MGCLVWFELDSVLFNSVGTVLFYRVVIFGATTTLTFSIEFGYMFRLQCFSVTAQINTQEPQ